MHNYRLVAGPGNVLLGSEIVGIETALFYIPVGIARRISAAFDETEILFFAHSAYFGGDDGGVE